MVTCFLFQQKAFVQGIRYIFCAALFFSGPFLHLRDLTPSVPMAGQIDTLI